MNFSAVLKKMNSVWCLTTEIICYEWIFERNINWIENRKETLLGKNKNYFTYLFGTIESRKRF